MFSKSTCPFCFELKNTLISYGINYSVFEIDHSPASMAAIQKVLKEKGGSATVPALFVKGEFLGGCTDIKDLIHAGTFVQKIAPYVGVAHHHHQKGPELKQLGLLWFPDTADANVVRLTSLLSLFSVIICCAFYNRDVTKWAVLGLAVEYFIRFVYGAAYSVCGAAAMAILSRVEPRWSCGAPKQFAAFCGLFFSALAALVFLAGSPLGALIVLCMLAGAQTLEGVFNFCLGCWMFGHAISFGVVAPSVYAPHLNLVASRKWMHGYTTATHNFLPAMNEHILLPHQSMPSPVDLIRKKRLETEYKLWDVNPIRHTRIDFFAIPMTAAALGFVFFVANETEFADVHLAYKALGLVAFIVFGLLFILYAIRGVMYPQKMTKEWKHPVVGNYFCTISITLTAMGALLLSTSGDGGLGLIWVGSVLQMLITVLRTADLVFDPVTEEVLNPSLMIPAVGNFLSAAAFVAYTQVSEVNIDRLANYLYIARVYFGVGATFGLLFFVITFRKALFDTHVDNRLRPTLWIWMATMSIASVAYVYVANASNTVEGLVFQSMWGVSCFLFLVNAVGMLKNFYRYLPFDMSVWVMPFSMCAFSASTILYWSGVNERQGLMFTISVITVAISCAMAAVCFLHTLGKVVDFSLFTARPKWGPLSQIKLAHETMRAALPKLANMALALNPANRIAVDTFANELSDCLLIIMEHSHHEDNVLFPAIRRYFPELNTEADKEHDALHDTVGKLEEALKTYHESHQTLAECQTLLTTTSDVLPAFETSLLEHLRHEENTITVVARKYLPLEYQIDITQRVFDMTSAEKWRRIMPYAVMNLPSPVWKVRYVKAFVWSNPLRAQEIGLHLYHGVDNVTWTLLATEIPAIVPRGAVGHKRLH